MKKFALNKEIFDKEIAQCKELSKKNGGKCNWGKCDSCGVILLLHKLAWNKVYETELEIEKLKKTTFK